MGIALKPDRIPDLGHPELEQAEISGSRSWAAFQKRLILKNRLHKRPNAPDPFDLSDPHDPFRSVLFLVLVKFIQAGLHLRQGTASRSRPSSKSKPADLFNIRPVTRRNDGNGIIDM